MHSEKSQNRSTNHDASIYDYGPNVLSGNSNDKLVNYYIKYMYFKYVSMLSTMMHCTKVVK